MVVEIFKGGQLLYLNHHFLKVIIGFLSLVALILLVVENLPILLKFLPKMVGSL